ncbi:type I-F CRISPR-associated protein Csy1 [Photobacterium indicum]|uniref:type I-F CRISPR-associated protein Csy1 n=1 Tax=Photobacterium indicum TaxID=81447 RepID=UPI003D12A2AA
MENTLSQAIADYIRQRKETKLEPLQKALNKVLDKSDDPVVIAAAKATYAEEAKPIEATFVPETWLSDKAKKASGLSMATHGPKYTHGDVKKTTSVADFEYVTNDVYLITKSIKSKAIDFVGNSAIFPIASLLKITVNNESLITQLQQGHINALTAFTDDEQRLQEWQAGFELALGDTKLSSHTLSKQLYFPLISEDKKSADYHLLCPLFSSALAHELYQQVRDTRYGDSKAIRDARKAGKYHADHDQSFPATAIQNFGGSKPQNISQLNNERHGQTYLLNSAPPSWKSQIKPPSNSSSFFGRELFYKTSAMIREFRHFLEHLKDDDRNMAIRHRRDNEFLLPIIDSALNHAAVIQMIENHAGWSSESESKMKHSHALWLDVYNPDNAFQTEREKEDWLVDIANDFASWLNNKLKSKSAKYLLGDNEHAHFKKLFLHQLKRFEQATPKLGEL